jgi:hypothetical protein
MTEEYHYDKLVMLQQIYSNSLSVDHSYAQPIPEVKSVLYPHQLTMIEGMHRYRERMTRGYVSGNHVINGKMGIIGDRAGSGKTLSILAYLASNHPPYPAMTTELASHSTTYFYSHRIVSIEPTRRANLIIVPHRLFSVWRAEIERHVTSPYVAIETRRMLRGDQLRENMIQSRFVLTTNKCYKFVQTYASQHQIEWDNIFIDDATMIHLHPSDPPLKFQFLWMVTNDWLPLIMKHPHIHKQTLYALRNRLPSIHPDLEHWLLDNIMIRYERNLNTMNVIRGYLSFYHPYRTHMILHHSNEFLESSMKLPCIVQQHIQCRPNINVNSLMSFYVSRNMEPMIRSHQIPYLFQSLSISWKTKEEYEEEVPSLHRQRAHRKMEENECVICFEPCVYPTVLRCCHHVYCGKCILRNMLQHSKCPMCRESITVSSLCCLGSLDSNDRMIQSNKMEACIDMIKKNPKQTFVIYSSFDNIYDQLAEEIEKLGIKAERIDKNLFSLLRTVRQFQQGGTQVLFISNVDQIRGMSFPSTSQLIFYHEPPVFEWKEVLIHSMQRLGRTQPLQIQHLHSEIQV